MPLNDSTNSADLKVIATAGVTFRLFDFVTQNLLLVPFFLCSSSDSLVLWFFWFLWFSWFSGSCGSLVLLVLVVPWFFWFSWFLWFSWFYGSCFGSLCLVALFHLLSDLQRRHNIWEPWSKRRNESDKRADGMASD